jgi:hypothetical protein
MAPHLRWSLRPQITHHTVDYEGVIVRGTSWFFEVFQRFETRTSVDEEDNQRARSHRAEDRVHEHEQRHVAHYLRSKLKF